MLWQLYETNPDGSVTLVEFQDQGEALSTFLSFFNDVEDQRWNGVEFVPATRLFDTIAPQNLMPSAPTTECPISVLTQFEADIVSSPRANEEAESLAFWATKSIAAPESDYLRIERDLASIRSFEPNLNAVRAEAYPRVQRAIDLYATNETREQFLSRLACVHRLLGATQLGFVSSNRRPSWRHRFGEKRFNWKVLSRFLDSELHIGGTSPGPLWSDSSDINVFAEKAGDKFLYLFTTITPDGKVDLIGYETTTESLVRLGQEWVTRDKGDPSNTERGLEWYAKMREQQGMRALQEEPYDPPI